MPCTRPCKFPRWFQWALPRYIPSVIPAGEYTVSYSNNKNVSTDDQKATVTITNNEGGNYIVSGSVTFEIRKGGAELTGSPQAKDLTWYPVPLRFRHSHRCRTP